MKKMKLIFLAGLIASSVSAQDLRYDDFFTGKTMRIDYNHSGTSREEHFAIQQIVSDGIWAGSQTKLIDGLKLGIYFFEIHDRKTGKILYSRGFSSLFAEWQTTPEAHEKWGGFSESMRFPWPKSAIELVLKKRDNRNTFEICWTVTVDPDSRQVNKAEMVHNERTDIILKNGPPQEKIDLVILGDGYTVAEMKKFDEDARRLSSALMNAEPFSQEKMISISSQLKLLPVRIGNFQTTSWRLQEKLSFCPV